MPSKPAPKKPAPKKPAPKKPIVVDLSQAIEMVAASVKVAVEEVVSGPLEELVKENAALVETNANVTERLGVATSSLFRVTTVLGTDELQAPDEARRLKQVEEDMEDLLALIEEFEPAGFDGDALSPRERLEKILQDVAAKGAPEDAELVDAEDGAPAPEGEGGGPEDLDVDEPLKMAHSVAPDDAEEGGKDDPDDGPADSPTDPDVEKP